MPKPPSGGLKSGNNKLIGSFGIKRALQEMVWDKSLYKNGKKFSHLLLYLEINLLVKVIVTSRIQEAIMD
jgi:hypothetical protein